MTEIRSEVRGGLIRTRALLAIAFIGMAIGWTGTNAFAEPGVTIDKIVLGSTVPLSGTYASRSQDYQAGAKFYFSSINSKGGVHGRKIEIEYYDDVYDPQKTVENVRKMVAANSTFAIFQTFGTPGNKAILPLIESANLPLLTPNSGADFLRIPVNRNIFTMRPGFLSQAADMMKFLVEKKGIKEIGIFYQDDAFGTAGMTAIQAAMNPYGIKKVSQGAYTRNTFELEIAVEQIMKGNPKAVLLSGQAVQSVEFIKKCAEKGFKPIYMIYSSGNGPELLNGLKDTDAELYAVQDFPFVSAHPPKIVQDYVAVSKAAGAEPNVTALEGYVNAAFVTEAFKRAGPNLTRDALRKAIEAMNNVDLGGLPVFFSAKNHQGLRAGSLVKVAKGKYLPVEG